MSDYGPRSAPDYMARYYEHNKDHMKRQTAAARRQRRRRLIAAEPAGARPVVLTPRERQVLDLVAQGLLNKEIAARLCIAQGTVKEIVGWIYIKLRVRNRAEAVRWATEHKP